MLSLRSSKLGSIIASISNFIPPDHTHNCGFAFKNNLIVSIPAFFNYSSDDSEKAIKELASNFGNVLGEISIHRLKNLIHDIIS